MPSSSHLPIQIAFSTPSSALSLPKSRLHQFKCQSVSRRLSRRIQFTACQSHYAEKHSLDALLQSLRARHIDQIPHPASESQSRQREAPEKPGTVYLVGTGPGDPGLLTLRALHLISRADVVLYDRLVSDSILSYVNPDATMVYVGKQAGFHTRSQQDIHLLLSFFADTQRTVIRLKGGDPFIFGRGGEETDFLEQCGVRVVAIPGITAASGIAASLGIPLTMRGWATSVQYLTGHFKSGVNPDVGPVSSSTTYVIYMGLAQLSNIVSQFINGGLEPSTPAIAVERGTTPEQRSVASTLHDLPTLVQDAAFESPTLIIVGQVIKLSPYWEKCGNVVHGNLYQQEDVAFIDINDPVIQRALHTFDKRPTAHGDNIIHVNESLSF